MAVKSIVASRLALNLSDGVDPNGKDIMRRASYDLKIDADINQVNAVALALSSLCQSTLMEVHVLDTSELS